MRRQSVIGFTTATIVSCAMLVPAHAADVPVPEALAVFTPACELSNTQPAYTLNVTDEQGLARTEQLHTAAGLFRSQLFDPDFDLTLVRGQGTYQAVNDLLPSNATHATLPRMQRYLEIPRLRWGYAAGRYGSTGAATWEQGVDKTRTYHGSGIAPATCPGNPAVDATSASLVASSLGTLVTFNSIGGGTASQIDINGLISQASATGEVNIEEWSYVAPTIGPPNTTQRASLRAVQRSAAAATLDSTIRAAARSARRQSINDGGSVRDIRLWVGEDQAVNNVDRVLKLRYKQILGGSRIFRKNPYTGTLHSYTVTKVGRRVVVTRLAP